MSGDAATGRALDLRGPRPSQRRSADASCRRARGITSEQFSRVEKRAATAAASCSGPGTSAASAKAAAVDTKPMHGAAAAPHLCRKTAPQHGCCSSAAMRVERLQGTVARVRDGHEQPVRRGDAASDVRRLHCSAAERLVRGTQAAAANAALEAPVARGVPSGGSPLNINISTGPQYLALQAL